MDAGGGGEKPSFVAVEGGAAWFDNLTINHQVLHYR